MTALSKWPVRSQAKGREGTLPTPKSFHSLSRLTDIQTRQNFTPVPVHGPPEEARTAGGAKDRQWLRPGAPWGRGQPARGGQQPVSHGDRVPHSHVQVQRRSGLCRHSSCQGPSGQAQASLSPSWVTIVLSGPGGPWAAWHSHLCTHSNPHTRSHTQAAPHNHSDSRKRV